MLNAFRPYRTLRLHSTAGTIRLDVGKQVLRRSERGSLLQAGFTEHPSFALAKCVSVIGPERTVFTDHRTKNSGQILGLSVDAKISGMLCSGLWWIDPPQQQVGKLHRFLFRQLVRKVEELIATQLSGLKHP